MRTVPAGMRSFSATRPVAVAVPSDAPDTMSAVPSPHVELSKPTIVRTPMPATAMVTWPPVAKPRLCHGMPSRRMTLFPARSNRPETERSSRTEIVEATADAVPSAPDVAMTSIVLFGPRPELAKPVMVNVPAIAPVVVIVWPALKPCVIQSTPSARVIVVGVVLNVPVTASAVLPPPWTVVMPPCDADRAQFSG